MSKSHLITDVSPRAQTALGPFAPHSDTDTRKYGVMFAAVEGNAPHFNHLGQAVNNGIEFGQHKQHRLRWDEFKDREGKPHDVTLANGAKVRQLVCPIADVERKTQMESQDSTEMCRRESLLNAEQLAARDKADQYASRQIQELTLGEEVIDRAPAEHEQMDPAPPRAARSSGWTPERRAAAGARLKAARTAKSQPATT